jgi:hypothetical protein
MVILGAKATDVNKQASGELTTPPEHFTNLSLQLLFLKESTR